MFQQRRAGLSSLQQRGLSLVELIISVAIGAFIALAGSSLYINTVTTGTDVFDRTRATEQARAVVDTVNHDFRRIGYQAGQLLDNPLDLFTSPPIDDVSLGAATGESEDSCILYHYQTGAGPLDIGYFAFRLLAGTVQVSESSAAKCDDAPNATHWLGATEPETVLIDQLRFRLAQRCMDAESRQWLGAEPCRNFTECGSTRTCRERRRLDVTLCSFPADIGVPGSCQPEAGASTPDGQLFLRVAATSRNDRLFFATSASRVMALGDGAGVPQPSAPN